MQQPLGREVISRLRASDAPGLHVSGEVDADQVSMERRRLSLLGEEASTITFDDAATRKERTATDPVLAAASVGLGPAGAIAAEAA